MGHQFYKPIVDNYEELFSVIPDDTSLKHIYLVFRDIIAVKRGDYKLAKVVFHGLPPEVHAYLDKWRSRKSHPTLLLIHKILTNNLTKVVMYLDYPENVVRSLCEEEFLICLDSTLSLLSSYQQQGILHGHLGRECVYQVFNADGSTAYKMLDDQIYPQTQNAYKMCLMQQSIGQLRLVLNRYYLSPAQFYGLGSKEKYPKHDSFKSEVFCLGLFFYVCLTQQDDIYDFETFTIKHELIMEQIELLELRYYTKLLLVSMLQLEEDGRPDYLQLSLSFDHFSKELKHPRLNHIVQDLIYNEKAHQPLMESNNQAALQVEEIMEAQFDPFQSFDGLSFTQKSETPQSQIPETKAVLVNRSYISNIKSVHQHTHSLEQGVVEKNRIDLPCLGYHDVRNWTYAKGNCRYGKFEGFITLKFSNGDTFEGEFSNDKANGQGKYVEQYGETIEGEWINNIYQYKII